MKCTDGKHRCGWVNLNNPKYVKYHDEEWGVPVHDDRKFFEMLVLESFQSGISWECILNKRENFRKAFENFNIEAVSLFDEKKIDELSENPGIVRSRRKIEATVRNAGVFKNIQKEWGSFSNYIWSFTDNRVIKETDKISSPLSDRISKDLKARGMSFVGSVTIYSYLQATGIIYSHENTCFLNSFM